MMQHFRNQMALQAQLAQAGRAESAVGIVTSYDPGNAAARVRIQPIDPDFPDRSLTGWLPVTSPWIGNGWGLDAPVSPGDQVEVKFFGGEIESGYICGRLYSDQQRPTGAKSGEFFMTHASGSALKFTNDGNVSLNVAGNLSATVTGNLTASAQQANVTASASASVSAPSISLKNAGSALKSLLNSMFATWAASHVHSNGNGGANTGTPTTSPPAGSQTSVVQAE